MALRRRDEPEEGPPVLDDVRGGEGGRGREGERLVPLREPPGRDEVKELALLFGKLGFTAFGGPAAHIALMEEEVVRRRKWLTHEGLLDLLGATNLIPGPNSTELALHIGHVRAGLRGMFVAGFCFIMPEPEIF